MPARLVSGSANPALAHRVAGVLGGDLVNAALRRFPDGELCPLVGSVRGDDVYLIQPTGPAVNEHLVELLMLLDACRRAGAARVTAVVPYFGYARQDRRERSGQAVGAAVAAKMIASAGADRLVVVDPHTPTLEAMCTIPVETLTAVPALAGALTEGWSAPAVVVAPDLGAVKLAERYASRLHSPVAVVRKSRISGAAVRAVEVVGTVTGLRAIVVDDMISTGATIEATVGLLVERGVQPSPTVVATHGLLIGPAPERLGRLSLGRLVVSDTVAPSPGLPLEVHTIAPLLAQAIDRLHRDEPLDGLSPPT